MKVISVVNNLACWFDHQMLYKAACTIDNCDSVGISIIISISQFLKLELNLKIGIIPIVKRNPVVYCKFMSILYLTLAVSGNLTTSSNWYLTSSFLCKNSLNLKANYIISLRTFSSFFLLPIQKSNDSIPCLLIPLVWQEYSVLLLFCFYWIYMLIF